MKKVYEKPEAVVVTFDSVDGTNAITTSSVSALKDVKKTAKNAISF